MSGITFRDFYYIFSSSFMQSPNLVPVDAIFTFESGQPPSFSVNRSLFMTALCMYTEMLRPYLGNISFTSLISMCPQAGVLCRCGGEDRDSTALSWEQITVSVSGRS